MNEIKVIALIPTRLESKRLPGKPLLDLDGLPLVIHTYRRSLLSNKINEAYICTHNKEIIDICKKYNANYILTKDIYKNGTERIASVSKRFGNSLILDIQGDDPLVSPKLINKIINYHKKNFDKADIVIPGIKASYNSPNSIIRIVSSKDGKILYMSRSKIPYNFKKKITYINKHASIISFKQTSLSQYSKLKKTFYESIEDIELLRALENNMNLYTFSFTDKAFSVDLYDDYLKAKIAINKDEYRNKY